MRKTDLREKKNPETKFDVKNEIWESSETRFGKVSYQSEPSALFKQNEFRQNFGRNRASIPVGQNFYPHGMR